MKCMECLNEDVRKKEKGQILYIRSRDDHVATSAKLLDITYESYEFSGDLIETIN